jgi:hypothetical protein
MTVTVLISKALIPAGSFVLRNPAPSFIKICQMLMTNIWLGTNRGADERSLYIWSSFLAL